MALPHIAHRLNSDFSLASTPAANHHDNDRDANRLEVARTFGGRRA